MSLLVHPVIPVGENILHHRGLPLAFCRMQAEHVSHINDASSYAWHIVMHHTHRTYHMHHRPVTSHASDKSHGTRHMHASQKFASTHHTITHIAYCTLSCFECFLFSHALLRNLKVLCSKHRISIPAAGSDENYQGGTFIQVRVQSGWSKLRPLTWLAHQGYISL